MDTVKLLRPWLLPLLLLVTLPASATTGKHQLLQLELREMGGLKALYTRLHTRLESALGNSGDIRILLESPQALQQLLARHSSSRHKAMKQAYTRLLGEWQQYQQVAALVLGSARAPGYSQSFDAFIRGKRHKVSASRDSLARDARVARLEMLGYTCHEIGDVISGHISLLALNRSGRMRALGYDQKTISAYLERHYKGPRGGALRLIGNIAQPSDETGKNTQLTFKTARRQSSQRQQLEGYVSRYARLYKVDANLVRAVITNESSWRAQVRSPAGALGPMQLMPATAKSLGVDPQNPEENIEGGVRYLAELLDLFDGDVDAALVSYNAGPSHADKWRKGDSVLFGETREYLRRVKESYAKLRL